MIKKIVPHLWFDKEAKEAAEFYVAIFSDLAVGNASVGTSKITNVTTIHDTPSGDCDIVSFELLGQPFMAISAGPLFKFTPSVSFHIKCQTIKEVDSVWEKLLVGGTVLMELGAYPFSKRYGWIQDKYGVSWQVIYTEGDFKQRLIPVFMFTGDVCGKAEEAINFYSSVFPESTARVLARYTKGEEPDHEGTVKYAQLILNGQEFGVMESAHQHNFTFNESISFIVYCRDQEEIDYYWKKLSAVPKAEQCGWVKDQYGLSWQIVPAVMDEMMQKGTPEQIARVTQSFLAMKKFDIKELEKAYTGK